MWVLALERLWHWLRLNQTQENLKPKSFGMIFVELVVWLVSGFGSVLVERRFELKSLILAQIERWRHA